MTEQHQSPDMESTMTTKRRVFLGYDNRTDEPLGPDPLSQRTAQKEKRRRRRANSIAKASRRTNR